MDYFSRRQAIRSSCVYLLSGSLGISLGCSKAYLNESNVTKNSTSNASENLPQESGQLTEEISRLKQLVFRKNSGLYQSPNREQREAFFQLAQMFINQDLNQAHERGKMLNYEVVKFLDTESNNIFYGLREKLFQGQQSLGWGSYFINPNYQTDVLIEVPHPLFDVTTPEIGINTFLQSSARGFLMAGSHRHGNGHNTADVCDPIASIFQKVHEAWMLPETKIWQIHGFNLEKYPQFPKDTQLVISNGQGEILPEILALTQALKGFNFQGYVYNRLPISAVLNQQVNQNINGTVFSALGATQNVQGIEAYRRGNPFLHVEIERQLRKNESLRSQLVDCLAQAIRGKV